MAIRPARANDLHSISTLLEAANLPTDDVEQWVACFLVAETDEKLVAAIGLEPYGQVALLRSLVVDPEHRGEGWGGAMVHALALECSMAGVKQLFLLTTDAADYFATQRFRVVERSQVPAEIQSTRQFRELCPGDATVMLRDLG